MPVLKKIASYVLRISISVVLLIFVFWFQKIDPRTLIEVVAGSNILLMSLAFFLSLVSYALCFFRWKMILETLGATVSTGRLVAVFARSVLWGALVPSTIGSDFVRSLDLSVQTKKTGPVVAAVLLDRLSGFAGMALMALIALAAAIRFIFIPAVVFGIGTLTAVLLVILLVIFNKNCYLAVNRLLYSSRAGKVRSTLKAIHSSMYQVRHHKGMIVNNLLLSLVVQILGPICSTIVASALGFKINILYFFLIVPIITAVTMIPISIAGLGTRDATTVLLLKEFGIGRDVALAISLLGFVFIVVTAVIGGIVYYVLTLHYRRLQPDSSP